MRISDLHPSQRAHARKAWRAAMLRQQRPFRAALGPDATAYVSARLTRSFWRNKADIFRARVRTLSRLIHEHFFSTEE